ncbi:extracellular solute-binding protein family 3 [Desulfarculus baarsii DSM 2075]|uniref:Extracellular solute-binding protein family 3 n=1 Tax=Desulfarculus baarsii (strain ATCC 33931 / DSM 2075 / LMG 7858 / VKM B-1802 / 2st14) TaxID=644282 RepID=E1QLM6_DESB2|nr:lytic transglycosylase F [Desulfarculus baarsii]ADK86461.1 extracellular solute-binding protein family 3 [Desulfarculus baarsii DSM 2075]
MSGKRRFGPIGLAALWLALWGLFWPPPAQAEPPPDLAKARFVDDLPAMEQRGFIRFGVAYSPTYFFFQKGRPTGYEYSLAEKYRLRLNERRRAQGQPPVDLLFVPMTRDRLIPALLEGRVDVIAAGLTITDKRAAQADFTAPYLDGVEEWIVSGKKVGGLKSLDDLAGREVCVRRSSSYFDNLLRLNQSLAARGLPPIKIVPAEETLATEDILEMVSAGIVPITVADSHMAELWAQALPGLALHRKLALAKGDRLAWMVRPSNPLLKASLDEFLAGRRQSAVLSRAKFKNHCRPAQRLKNPFSAKNMRRYAQCRPYIDKYAAKAGMDPLLVAALAFVESGFNPKAKSPGGAVGVMQLRPGGSGGRRYNAAQLQDPEINIRLGVGYLAQIRDTCFTDRDMAEEDRMLFALAAYNAGPRRLSTLRERACDMGQDPNVWFWQSEVAAHKVLSDHSVHFVRRVNKIYAAYKFDQRRRQGDFADN